ncbi:hypothetical protein VP01_435g7 [Puccinia sorghi]|uniref:Uncharacterized protein n=1 Tax=Puccinia sorghi TaxID=27349 RepID=A0A0L6UPU2_9BASI|nr:hypothetical protein VP01_435g7 [Puccinia sorghi]
MANERNTYRELVTWGSTLDFEPTEVSRRAKQVFQRAKNKLSLERGHQIVGVNGNDRALACLCLCLVKCALLFFLFPLELPTATSTADRKAIETSLQRTSGVSARVFSGGLKELPRILEDGRAATTSTSASTTTTPTRARPGTTPSRAKKEEKTRSSDHHLHHRQSLLVDANTPRKPTLDPQEPLLSPSRKRPHNQLNTPIQTSASNHHKKIRSTISKTPLLLPINKPPKPMSIFASIPVFNPNSPSSSNINFSDWNWKSTLFHNHWSLQHVQDWQQWNQTAVDKSLV